MADSAPGWRTLVLKPATANWSANGTGKSTRSRSPLGSKMLIAAAWLPSSGAIVGYGRRTPRQQANVARRRSAVADVWG
jgi:hypothetical protein